MKCFDSSFLIIAFGIILLVASRVNQNRNAREGGGKKPFANGEHQGGRNRAPRERDAKCLCFIGETGNLQLWVALKKILNCKFFAAKERNFPDICLAGCQQGSHLGSTKGSCFRQPVLCPGCYTGAGGAALG